MNALLVLIPISVVLIAAAIWAFVWAVNAGQFDDLDTPGYSVIGEGEDSR